MPQCPGVLVPYECYMTRWAQMPRGAEHPTFNTAPRPDARALRRDTIMRVTLPPRPTSPGSLSSCARCERTYEDGEGRHPRAGHAQIHVVRTPRVDADA